MPIVEYRSCEKPAAARSSAMPMEEEKSKSRFPSGR